MRTATLILGLIAATALLLGGSCAAVFGTIGESFEESFEIELEEDKGGVTSTSEDVTGAAFLALIVSLILYIGAGLAKVALKTSTALLAMAFILLILTVMIDTTSLFATFYYLATALTAVGVILMLLSYFRYKQSEKGR